MVLETLGLGASAERIYRAMLAHPSEGVTQLANRLDASLETVREGLGQLSKLAIVQPSPHEENGFRVVAPETAMEMLLARQHAELAAQQLRVEASRAAAAQLIAECSGVRPRASDDERLLGPEAIRERLGQLASQTEADVMTFAPGGAHTPADLEASKGPNEELLQRGVRSRTIYLDSARNHRPTLDHVSWLNRHGAVVRTAVSLPVRMIIFDRRQAVLPIDTADAHTGAVLLNGAGTITALCALFEATWAAATPLGATASPTPEGMTAQQAEMLKLLAAGMTDETIAKRFGISPRTARRIAADLMDLLEARSRFQAGVHSVQRGWLPAHRS
ncbi:helix-turn-helix domain-containing protein [Streptomyces sp. NPDC005525]|uniref:helix-turn-helix domain-containing protein n=1 Tax=Streptomyces sp. NPDC005525 TaxID=3364720 RepID=UPI0036984509